MVIMIVAILVITIIITIIKRKTMLEVKGGGYMLGRTV